MASIRKRGNSYLLIVSMGYDFDGKRRKPQQKTVHPPEDLRQYRTILSTVLRSQIFRQRVQIERRPSHH